MFSIWYSQNKYKFIKNLKKGLKKSIIGLWERYILIENKMGKNKSVY